MPIIKRDSGPLQKWKLTSPSSFLTGALTQSDPWDGKKNGQTAQEHFISVCYSEFIHKTFSSFQENKQTKKDTRSQCILDSLNWKLVVSYGPGQFKKKKKFFFCHLFWITKTPVVYTSKCRHWGFLLYLLFSLEPPYEGYEMLW